MSGSLRLDIRNLSLGRRHLVNAYKVEAGTQGWIPNQNLTGTPSPSLPFPPLPLEVGPLIQLGGLGERCKLPQWGLGRSPSRQSIWCISWSKGAALVATVL